MPDWQNINWLQVMLDVGTPLCFVLVGIYANRLGARDNSSTPLKNYFAVGTSVLIMSLATILADITVDSAGKFDINFGWMVFYLIFIFVFIDFDRYISWVRDEGGNPTDEKDMFKGIIMPNLLAVCAFCLYRFLS